MNKGEERGRLLYQGMKGYLADTIKGQKEIFIVYFLIGIIFLFWYENPHLLLNIAY